MGNVLLLLLFFVNGNLCFLNRDFLGQHLHAYGPVHSKGNLYPVGVGRGFSMEVTLNGSLKLYEGVIDLMWHKN